MSFHQRKQQHDSFENRVYTELKQRGFVIHDLTYHTHLEHETAERLRQIRTPTALLVRTRADRIAMHQTVPAVTKIEVKTSGYTNGSFAIEAFPLAAHIIETQTLGAQCLYICLQRALNYEFGFWTDEIHNRITGIYIPPSWHNFARQFSNWLLNAFPHTPIHWLNTETHGSNTPYALIPPSIVRSLKHWQSLLDNWLKTYHIPPPQPQPQPQPQPTIKQPTLL